MTQTYYFVEFAAPVHHNVHVFEQSGACMNTQSKEVNLLKRIKTADGWYFFPAALTAIYSFLPGIPDFKTCS